jgi:hypothetical protein
MCLTVPADGDERYDKKKFDFMKNEYELISVSGLLDRVKPM